MSGDPVLEVDGLTLEVLTRRGPIRPVQDVSFSLADGEAFALVGESGCGKTMTLRSILRLLPGHAQIVSGSVRFEGREITMLSNREFRTTVRGRIGIVFQEPLSALNPVMRVGDQIAEGAQANREISRRAALEEAIELMAEVGIPDPRRRSTSYPHELSGGTRQRILIAIALSSKPRVLLCDEPTTALDVTIQDQILKLLRRLRDDTGLGLLLVSHDLAVVAETCRTLAVMYAGNVVEIGSVERLLTNPRHAYTLQLLRSVPDVDNALPVKPIPGAPPDFHSLPEGCRFAPRCSLATEECRAGEFPLRLVEQHHLSACIHHRECAAERGQLPS